MTSPEEKPQIESGDPSGSLENQTGLEFQSGEGAEGEKSYTQAEWANREKELITTTAAKDREIATSRQLLASQALEKQAQEAATREANARAVDAEAVEDGDITTEQAQQRSLRRENERQEQDRSNRTLEATRAASDQIMEKAEQAGRTLAAQDYAKEYGVDAGVLLKDSSIKTPEQMENKAMKLSIAKNKGERFDSGQMGSRSVDVEKMSAMEKITAGLKAPAKR
jgi:hypothetical protein